MGNHVEALSTQERNPRSAVARTIIVAAIALFPILNATLAIVQDQLQPYAVNLPGWVFLALNAAVTVVTVLIGIGTRIMAVPGFNAWLRQYLPIFAPEDNAK